MHIIDNKIDKKSLNSLEEILIIKDLTYKEVAVIAGLRESTVYRIAKGQRVPNQLTMIKICNGLGMKAEEVFVLDLENVKFV